MKRVPATYALLALGPVLAAAAGGCSDRSSARSGAAADDADGSVGLALMVAPGMTLNTVSYVITGPSTFRTTGAIDVSQSATVSAIISGLPPGTGYSVALNGTTTDGTTRCMGSGAFGHGPTRLSRNAPHGQCPRDRHGQRLPGY